MNYEINNGILYTINYIKCPDCSERGRVYKLDLQGNFKEHICWRCDGASMIKNDVYLLEPVNGIVDMPSKLPLDYDS